jgi:hypothetical protein
MLGTASKGQRHSPERWLAARKFLALSVDPVMGHYGSARIALFCSASATLRRTIADFVAHYHGERNYHGIDNELIQPLRQADAEGTVRRRQRMGGMLNYYYRAA